MTASHRLSAGGSTAEIGEFSTYLVLSYIAQTAAHVVGDLVPAERNRRGRLEEWLSSGFGVLLALATGVDLLTDLGIPVVWPPAGVAVTGLLLGQGARFGSEMLSNMPLASSRRRRGARAQGPRPPDAT